MSAKYLLSVFLPCLLPVVLTLLSVYAQVSNPHLLSFLPCQSALTENVVLFLLGLSYCGLIWTRLLHIPLTFIKLLTFIHLLSSCLSMVFWVLKELGENVTSPQVLLCSVFNKPL